MENTQLIELYRAAARGYEAQADECNSKIAELTGTEPKKRGRPAGSRNKSEEPEKEESV